MPELRKKIEDEMMNTFKSYMAQIPHLRGEKGDSIIGPRGPMGAKPVQGINYEIPKNGQMGPKPIAGIDYPIPKDGEQGFAGKDGSPDTPQQIANKLNTLTEVIDKSVIKGLDTFLQNLQRSIREKTKVFGGGGGASTPKTPVEVVDGIRTEFSVISEPIYVVSDGISYFPNNGYTYSLGRITITIPPSQYIRYIV